MAAEASSGQGLTAAEVLAAIPHGPPFRFVDDILEMDDEHIVASCRFDAGADFYRGHFPGNPITPGVLLLEAMAQAGVVAHGIYLLGRPALESGREMLTLFTQAEAEFTGIVRPGERVFVHARKLTFRHRMLRSKVRMVRDDGSVVCEATLTGVGVPKKLASGPDSEKLDSGPDSDGLHAPRALDAEAGRAHSAEIQPAVARAPDGGGTQ
jgi:3-hydroxyacyl-[acyl-carrier-protein] dehydratase